jgi:hypothetical protein
LQQFGGIDQPVGAHCSDEPRFRSGRLKQYFHEAGS